jgi:hypothetical protein
MFACCAEAPALAANMSNADNVAERIVEFILILPPLRGVPAFYDSRAMKIIHARPASGANASSDLEADLLRL